MSYDVKQLFDGGGSVREALDDLKAQGANTLEAIKALCLATPLSLQEAKQCSDDYLHGNPRYQEELNGERLALLQLARTGEYLHRFFRDAILHGKRWLTLAQAPSGFDFWWKAKREGNCDGSWSGQDLPSLEGLRKSFIGTLNLQPRLAAYVEITAATPAEITLRIRLEA